MNHSTPDLPVYHQLPEFTQTQSQWCHPAISSSVVPFSSCPHSLLASESLPMSQLFAWGGQSTAELSKKLPSKKSFQRNPRADLLQNGLAGSPCSPRDSQESSSTPQLKASILRHSGFFVVQLSHLYMTTGKTIALTIWTFGGKGVSLLFNTLSLSLLFFQGVSIF